MNKKQKILIIIIAAIVVIGGAIGGYFGYSAYQEKKQQEEIEAFLKAIEEEQNSTINAFNERINGIVNPLLVADANGQNPSLDNNIDIDALTNAVNELNNVINDVNNDTLLMQEQKDAVNGNVTNQINVINARIGAVNEENARVEAEANAKAEAQRQAQAQASSNKKKNSGGSSSSSSSSASGNNAGGTSNSVSSAGAGESAAPAAREITMDDVVKGRTSREEALAYLKEHYGDVYDHNTGEKL